MRELRGREVRRWVGRGGRWRGEDRVVKGGGGEVAEGFEEGEGGRDVEGSVGKGVVRQS